MLNNLYYPAFPGVAILLNHRLCLGQLDLYRITVHGRGNIVLGNKDVRLILRHALRGNKAEAPAINGNPAGNIFFYISIPPHGRHWPGSSPATGPGCLVLAFAPSPALAGGASLPKGLFFHGNPPVYLLILIFTAHA